MQTLSSIFAQDFEDYDIVIGDDCSPDDTKDKVKAIADSRIVYHRNLKRLGYAGNLQSCLDRSVGEIVYLMGDDDIMLPGALSKTLAGFSKSEVGLVTRPYYWFWEVWRKPIRAILPYNPNANSEISIFDGIDAVRALFRSAGQLSGLAYKRECMDIGFHPDVFTSHIYPFASILKRHKAVYLRDFVVAVRTPLSMTSARPEIYQKSPLESWVHMFLSIYREEEFKIIKDECIWYTVRDSLEGLIQIKTATSSSKAVAREIKTALKYAPGVVRERDLYLFGAAALLVPSKLLRTTVDWYKKNLLSRKANSVVNEATNVTGRLSSGDV